MIISTGEAIDATNCAAGFREEANWSHWTIFEMTIKSVIGSLLCFTVMASIANAAGKSEEFLLREGCSIVATYRNKNDVGYYWTVENRCNLPVQFKHNFQIPQNSDRKNPPTPAKEFSDNLAAQQSREIAGPHESEHFFIAARVRGAWIRARTNPAAGRPSSKKKFIISLKLCNDPPMPPGCASFTQEFSVSIAEGRIDTSVGNAKMWYVINGSRDARIDSPGNPTKLLVTSQVSEGQIIFKSDACYEVAKSCNQYVTTLKYGPDSCSYETHGKIQDVMNGKARSWTSGTVSSSCKVVH